MPDLSTLPSPTTVLRDSPVIAAAPEELRGLFTAGAVAGFEDAEDYAGMFMLLAQTVSPRDAIEWIWVKDLADLSWEARRLRGAKAAVLALSRAQAVGEVRQVERFERVAPGAFGEVEIDGHAYRRTLEDMERLDRLITIAAVRRDAVLRELDLRRARIKAMRDAAMRAEHASFDTPLRAGSATVFEVKRVAMVFGP
jgi:hypothetical protein